MAYENASAHGFKHKNFAEAIALIHSELSEALEEDRKGAPQVYYAANGKPEGVAVELADAVIRICDLCGYLKIDLEKVIAEKMEYNAGRPHLHGKRY
jgi:NTP pyrophosphatase (non-canonical NTP hydrolase)